MQCKSVFVAFCEELPLVVRRVNRFVIVNESLLAANCAPRKSRDGQGR